MRKRKPSPRVNSLMRSFSFCARAAVKAMKSADRKRAAVEKKYAPDVAWDYHSRAWSSDLSKGWLMFNSALNNLRAAQKLGKRKS